jgi:hypothetical protein
VSGRPTEGRIPTEPVEQIEQHRALKTWPSPFRLPHPGGFGLASLSESLRYSSASCRYFATDFIAASLATIKEMNCNVSMQFHMQNVQTAEKHAHKTVIKLSHNVTQRDWHRLSQGASGVSV